MRELARVHLVGAARDRNRANRREIRFANRTRCVYGFGARFSGAVVVGEGWYDLR
jgi:hypothetical protein